MAGNDRENAATAAPEEPPLLECAESEAIAEAETLPWRPPPGQPIRIVAAILMMAAGAALYGYVLTSFWSSPSLGIHDRVPYPAFVLIAGALVLAVCGFGLALGIWSPHAKLAIGILSFFTCVAIGVGGGRFASYTTRGTLNPRFHLHLAVGARFPDFALKDEHGVVHSLADTGVRSATLIVIYRGDFCPFARFELAELTANRRGLANAGVRVEAISTDPADRGQKLASFLQTDIPLLSDASESLLGPLGLIEHHRNGEADNAVPAYFLLDKDHVVRWIFTSPYYRELPRLDAIVKEAARLGARP